VLQENSVLTVIDGSNSDYFIATLSIEGDEALLLDYSFYQNPNNGAEYLVDNIYEWS
jgi:hypothetical protein